MRPTRTGADVADTETGDPTSAVDAMASATLCAGTPTTRVLLVHAAYCVPLIVTFLATTRTVVPAAKLVVRA